ncbi:hypothetical protein GYMLUDRAFT_244041 [Collybiopsis luxurians FD-317 M1]|uniref:Cytochrome P450 n=1 Tax=Collybiopsis luxurians FD-317 M1 TaxID=944289 RepID=A0A0D0CXD9_9AGAR|nr:hypothetical protein GYMLUDRAFT_244041 [Collybiopsis luxurians FD-317 M1]
MLPYSTMVLTTTLLAGIVFLVLLTYKVTKRSPFWNIRGPKSHSFVIGNIWEVFHRPTGQSEFEWQDTYGAVIRLKASFGSEQLMITDHKALQHIFQETDYRWRKSKSRRELSRLTSGRGLAWADGDSHRRQRRLMVPAFGAPEAKHFLPYFLECANTLVSRWTDILSISPQQSEILNIPEWTTRFALDALGQAAFDYDFGAIKNQDSDHSGLHSKKLSAKTFGIPTKGNLLTFELFRYVPSWVVEYLNDHNPKFALLHRVAQVATNTAKDLIAMKSIAVMENKNKKDVMSILVKANMDSQNPNARLTEEEIWATIRVLIFAGHETSANTAAWMLLMGHEDGQITVQDLESMPLLNAVVKETLRVHPTNPLMSRTSVEDDILPLSKPITTTTGELLQELLVPKGTTVLASVAAYNRNTDVFGEDASEFNPDRWLEPGHIASGVSFGVYANLATFSAGIRSCIGWRFAVLELQTILYELLRNFEFSATPELDNVQRVTAFIMIPAIEGELEKGSRMPLKVTFAPKDEE